VFVLKFIVEQQWLSSTLVCLQLATAQVVVHAGSRYNDASDRSLMCTAGAKAGCLAWQPPSCAAASAAACCLLVYAMQASRASARHLYHN
jgi:hypothetical protein